ncbi:MAG TPA: hypothetical protein PLO78_09705 [Candidatus Omnitrophota bacterium]|nr:hypothetical protein [Candidatus Omnitrophota bacterium]
MKKNEWRKISFLAVGSCFLLSPLTYADTDVSSKDVAVRKVGVSWNMAEDRRIENNGGIYQPEGEDKYIKRLIDGLSAKVDQLIAQTNRIEKKLDSLGATSNAGNGTLISEGGNNRKR